jgi:ArsR family transcriptional regulator
LFKLQAELCKTFADPSRLIIIQELRDGEKSVSELQSVLDIPQPVVSHHLAILKSKGDIVHEILVNQMKKSNELNQKLIG